MSQSSLSLMARITLVFLAFTGLSGAALAESEPSTPASVHMRGLSLATTQIAFQGFLTENGTAKNGTATMVATIWTDSLSGDSLWSESHSSVSVTTGIFRIALGSVTPLEITDFTGSPIYLGISVDGQPELPRTRLMASPFAIRAAEADHALTADVALATTDSLWSANGADVYRLNGNVGIGTATPSHLLDIVAQSPVNFLSRVKGFADAEVRCAVEDGLGGRGYVGKATYPLAGFQFLSQDPGSAVNIVSDEGDINLRVHPNAGATWEDVTLTKLHVDAGTGNIGVGTTTPATKLDVHTTDATRTLRWTVDSGVDDGSFATLGSNNDRGALFLGNPSPYGGPSDEASLLNTTGGWQWTRQLNIMGNVGVGTTSPTVSLDVAGNGHLSGNLSVDGTISGSFNGTISNALLWDGHSWGEIYPNADQVDGLHGTQLLRNGNSSPDPVSTHMI